MIRCHPRKKAIHTRAETASRESKVHQTQRQCHFKAYNVYFNKHYKLKLKIKIKINLHQISIHVKTLKSENSQWKALFICNSEAVWPLRYKIKCKTDPIIILEVIAWLGDFVFFDSLVSSACIILTLAQLLFIYSLHFIFESANL